MKAVLGTLIPTLATWDQLFFFTATTFDLVLVIGGKKKKKPLGIAAFSTFISKLKTRAKGAQDFPLCSER